MWRNLSIDTTFGPPLLSVDSTFFYEKNILGGIRHQLGPS
jgi:hypothetical protein